MRSEPDTLGGRALSESAQPLARRDVRLNSPYSGLIIAFNVSPQARSVWHGGPVRLQGASEGELLEDYPHLAPEDVPAAIAYGAASPTLARLPKTLR
ncbi:MAG: DUF433 domain-containing protein [Terriglobia bacterium]